MMVNTNVSQLSEADKRYIRMQKSYSYVYGVGLIFFPDGGSWDCTNTVAAKEYLDNLKIPEKS